MNSIVIDTNPLAYIYTHVPDYGEKFAVLLWELGRHKVLTIPKIVYGELSILFKDIAELNAFLSDTGIVIGEIVKEAYADAAERWQRYNRRRILICHRCGTKIGTLACKECGESLRIRQHVLSDFIIGAYALNSGKKIVTGDAGYYKTYFPELHIITI
jgi:predicted nucleic acid-binding protein